ncbi:MAG TPA: tetratricopeptide repeat protein [Opitutaceae bacterium]|nr:tetratricopeptide repeat protein [Opitutaceae bacterium]
MNSTAPNPPTPAGPAARSRLPALVAAAVIVLAALVAWHNSLSAPFIFDDEAVIQENPTIRHLGDLGTVLSPPAVGGGSGVTGRPVVNLSLALNYALGGLDVRGYHWFNLVVHILAALALFGIIRRTLHRLPALRPDATLFAFAAALLWTLHPLVTESVTCVVQRTELLVSLFYLLTLYCFIRGAEDGPTGIPPKKAARGVWYFLSVLSCVLGMATKEVMVTAPLVALLYDRAFLAGTFGAAWRRRIPVYLGLAATWILLGVLVLGAGGQRAGAVGFGLGVGAWSYALTQCGAIVHYLRLAFWPHPLVLDYGFALAHSPADVWWQGLIVLGLVAATILALVRAPRRGFLGAAFLLVLAPSSSVLPLITQTVAEHRMYLPLAAVVMAAALVAHRWLGRAGLAALLVLAVAFGWLTRLRNADYRSAVSIWADTVAELPSNPRAHGNLGNALLAAGRYDEAVAQYREALRLKPDYIQPYDNLGDALLQLHRPQEAAEALRGALRLFPADPTAHSNLGTAFLQLGRPGDAVREYEEALRGEPGSAVSEINLALALRQTGRLDEASNHYLAAVNLAPERVATRLDLAQTLEQKHDDPAAEQQYRDALRLQPGLVAAHFGLGNLLARTGRFAEAIGEYREAVRLDPGQIRARNNLGNALLMTGRLDEAIAEYEEALRLRPDDASVRENLERAQALRRGGTSGP